CPSDGNPDRDGDGIGDCTGGDCGEGGGAPGLDDGVPGFGEALGDFWERAGNAPIASALNGIRLQGAGTCSFPSVTVQYLGTLNFDVICEQSGWLDVLYGLMLAVWSLAAVRLFFTAGKVLPWMTCCNSLKTCCYGFRASCGPKCSTAWRPCWSRSRFPISSYKHRARSPVSAAICCSSRKNSQSARGSR